MKYRCKQSGNYIELTNEYDIEGMKGNENYEVVDDAQIEKPDEKRQTLKLARKKNGPV